MSRLRLFGPALAPVIAAAILLSAVLLVAPPARAGTAVVFIEDFEDGSIGAAWNYTDFDPASGLDYWGVTDFRTHAGNYSAWCAQVGTQSVGGQNNSDVQLYDDDMRADLSVNLSVSGFTSLTLSFYYWSKAESGGGDFIEAWFEAGGVLTQIFHNTGGTGNKWDLASVAVPNNVTQLIIRFETDNANHGFEGAYVDDIVLTGTEDVPPTSSVSTLPAYTNTVPYPIPYTAEDNANASGVAYVELYYRQGTTGAFSKYADPSNPLGQWTSPTIPFDTAYASGDGLYQFFTVAWDNAQNVETIALAADASMTIDTAIPTLAILAPAQGAWFASGSLAVSWQGDDALSGLDRYETSLDGSAFASVGLATTRALSSLGEGSHDVAVRAYDRAGNVIERSVGFGVDATLPQVATTSPLSGSWFNTDTVTVTWQGSDAASGLARYETSLDGGAFASVGLAASQEITGLPDGNHEVTVRAVDRAGNNATASVSFGVDVTKPTITILSPANHKVITNNRPTFRWNGTDATSGIDRYEVSLDGGVAEVMTATSWTSRRLADGTHSFHVVVVDRAGNTEEAIVSFAVNTNPFSWEGPYGPFPTLLLILAIALFLILLFLWWRRRQDEERREAKLVQGIDDLEERVRSIAPAEGEETAGPPSEPEGPESPPEEGAPPEIPETPDEP